MCLVCPLQNNSDVAIAKLQGTSGYLTHPPGHCGLELLPLSPESSRQRLLQGDANMPLAAESLAGEDTYCYVLAQGCGRSCRYGVEDLLARPARDYCYRARSVTAGALVSVWMDFLLLASLLWAALTLRERACCGFQEWMEGRKFCSFSQS